MITITIKARAISKDNQKRGVSRSGKYFVRPEFKAFENMCALEAKNQYRGPILSGRLSVTLEFHFSSKVHPDLFNLPKSVMDAMNGVLWVDDRQIVNGKIRTFVDVLKKYEWFKLTVEEIE